MNLTSRSYEKELLDDDSIPEEELKKNLRELNFINTWLGGHAISIAGLQKLIQHDKQITICEIGCGGGDNISVLNKWCIKNNINASFIGVDIKPVCIEFAKEKHPFNNVKWIISDYNDVVFDTKPDVIFSSLFCHHFTEGQLSEQITWMKENSASGFFINDLERNIVAYKSIKWLTKLFSNSYLVKHDAPLSVARGFTKNEWKHLFQYLQIDTYQIHWKWAFRHLIVYKHE